LPQRHCIEVHRKILGKITLKFQKFKVIHSPFGCAIGASQYGTSGPKTTKPCKNTRFYLLEPLSVAGISPINRAKPTHWQKTSQLTAGQPNVNRTSYSQLIHNACFTRFVCRERARSVVVSGVHRKKKDGRVFRCLPSSRFTTRTSQDARAIASAENEKAGRG
jgi:hypothetical protein